jgi:2-polyprenyl-3-methyl-5-hydroxy-6-metoxy-1,4-benzoquinol methylase
LGLQVTISSSRGRTVCRGCDAADLVPVLDLGSQPLANELSSSATVPDPAFPLHLRICPRCGLGQLAEFVPPERIFAHDYPYLSSVSSSWVAHAERYARMAVERLALGPDDLVIEVASNDGYLLERFAKLGVRVLGVEPAGGAAEVARSKGIPTVEAFFGSETAESILAQHGHPRLVVANNVMAHVPDLTDFVAGFSRLCDAGTVVTVENPSFVNLLTGVHFDTIYHEHFSYLTTHAVAQAVSRQGLELFRVQQLPTHGGSNRYWLGLAGKRPVEASVSASSDTELAAGLLDPERWVSFRRSSVACIEGFRDWLEGATSSGRSVSAYGAAAKGNTLLNAVGVTSNDVRVVADGSVLKQGKLLPGSKVPVVAPEELPGDADDVLVLPWNLAAEIVPLVRARVPGAACWSAVPEMHALS